MITIASAAWAGVGAAWAAIAAIASPSWAAIAAAILSGLASISALVAAVIGIRSKNKVQEISVMVDGQLTDVKRKLDTALTQRDEARRPIEPPERRPPPPP